MDETYKVAITRLGDRIRVGGMAELVGYNTTLREPAPGDSRAFVVNDLFPTGGDLGSDLLDRAAADDAGRPADHRPTPYTNSTSTPVTARWAGRWLRLRPRARRYHFRADAGDRARRSDYQPLRHSAARKSSFNRKEHAFDEHRQTEQAPQGHRTLLASHQRRRLALQLWSDPADACGRVGGRAISRHRPSRCSTTSKPC